MRPVKVGSATATFAARLATLPATSNAHGNARPPPRPRLGEQRGRRGHNHPIDDSGVSDATHPGYPCNATSRCM